MYHKILAHTLIFLFVSLFSYESIEFFCGEIFEHTENFSGILELEEETENSEESKKDNKEELKINDNYFIHNKFFHFELTTAYSIISLNQHYKASEYTSKFYSPPDFI
jgi:hypothetical protein